MLDDAKLFKVLIGFLAAAYLTLFVVVVYYLMGLVPEAFVNAVDRGVIRHKASSKSYRI